MVTALDGPPAADRAGAGRVPGLALGRDPRPDVERVDLDRGDLFVRSTLYVGRPTRFALVAPKTQAQPALDSRCRTSWSRSLQRRQGPAGL